MRVTVKIMIPLGHPIWEFPKIGVPYFGVLIIRILLFRVVCEGPLFSETPIYLILLSIRKPILRDANGTLF